MTLSAVTMAVGWEFKRWDPPSTGECSGMTTATISPTAQSWYFVKTEHAISVSFNKTSTIMCPLASIQYQFIFLEGGGLNIHSGAFEIVQLTCFFAASTRIKIMVIICIYTLWTGTKMASCKYLLTPDQNHLNSLDKVPHYCSAPTVIVI